MEDLDGVVRERISIETGGEERRPAYRRASRWASIQGACCIEVISRGQGWGDGDYESVGRTCASTACGTGCLHPRLLGIHGAVTEGTRG